jgi:hypothetical protein
MSAACPRYGFTLRLVPAPGADAALLRDALGAALAALGLEAEGAALGALVVTREGAQATHGDREAVSSWAASRADVAECFAGPIVDLSA